MDRPGGPVVHRSVPICRPMSSRTDGSASAANIANS